MPENEATLKFSYDDQTCLYAMTLDLNGRVLHIEMDIEKYETILTDMIKLNKDVNLMYARKHKET